MQPEIVFAKPEHLEEIYKIWGLNRAKLGLMPKDAFKDCIKKKWILVVLSNNSVLGYLQFRYTVRTQTLSIVHLCVSKEHRGHKYSEKLVDRLVEAYKSTARGIKLSCRSDYKEATAFWTRYNFQPKGDLPSRGTDPNVHLIIWWFSFGREDLFSIIQNNKIKAVLDFNIIAKLRDVELDDNCLEEIKQLQSDWLVSEVEYYQTAETTNELFRDTNKLRKQRTKDFLKSFPELNLDKSNIKLIDNELKAIFPGESDNDRSDRRQIAETILSGFPYFVTLDEGILNCKHEIFDHHELKIITPSTLIAEIDMAINAEEYYPNRLSGHNFTTSKLKPNERPSLETLFLNHGKGEKKSAFNATINELIANPTGCVQIIKQGEEIVAVIGYEEQDDFFNILLLRTKQDSLRQTIFIQNINDLLKIALSKRKSFIAIRDQNITDIESELLMNCGFFQQGSIYIRGIKSGLYAGNSLNQHLSKITSTIPELNSLVLEITNSGDSASLLNVISLEKLLWPLKIFDAKIPCYIIPIKPYYAKELFDTKAAKAELFGAQPKLIWSKENVYYRNIRPKVENLPARILWYSSSEKNYTRQKAIVCSSYLDEVMIGPANEMYKKHKKFGIYSWEKDILPLAKGKATGSLMILRFSDSEPFDQIVSLSKIKQVLASNNEVDNNFQSPLKIKSSTFMQLYALGKGITFNHE